MYIYVYAWLGYIKFNIQYMVIKSIKHDLGIYAARKRF